MRNDFQEGAFLAHSAKGTSWKNVKYLKKVKLASGKYYYIYTQAQLNAWNKSHSIEGNNVLSDKAKADVKKQVLTSETKSLEELQKSHFAIQGKTTVEKTANLKKNIKDGEDAIKKALEKEESKSKKSSSSKSSGSGSSGKSSKGSSGGSSKEKSASSAKKTAAEKTTAKTQTTQKKTENKTPINLDTLKKIYGAKDEDVTTHDMTAPEFKNKMLSKYDEGSFGYLMAGDKAYKWTIEGGQLVIKDFDTE